MFTLMMASGQARAGIYTQSHGTLISSLEQKGKCYEQNIYRYPISSRRIMPRYLQNAYAYPNRITITADQHLKVTRTVNYSNNAVLS